MVQLLGRAIKHLPRDQIIVATKVGKYIAGEPADFSAARVTKSVHESLERMQLKHIDLIQVHDIEFAEDMRQVRACSEPFLICPAKHFAACASGNQRLVSSDTIALAGLHSSSLCCVECSCESTLKVKWQT